MQITDSSSDRHVVVLVFPFSTNPGLLLGLIRRLAAASPNMTFSFYSTAKSNESLFSVPNPENIKPYPIWDGMPEGYVFSGNIKDNINLFLEVAKEGFKAAMRMAETEMGQRIGCVMADAFLWFAGSVAEEIGMLWVPLWTPGACFLSVHCYTDLIRKTVGIHGKKFGAKDKFIKHISIICTSISLF